MGNKANKIKDISIIDEKVKEGVYCVEPSKEDLQIFCEHAKKRLINKQFTKKAPGKS